MATSQSDSGSKQQGNPGSGSQGTQRAGTGNTQTSAPPRKRGFAAMDQNQQREIASRGGQAAHQKGTAHEFSSAEARLAGQKGGEAVSRDRVHMADIGRKGGESRQAAQRSGNLAASPGQASGADRQDRKNDA